MICSICEKELKTSASLGAHLKLSHGISPAHGTVGAYLAHKRKKEVACPECKAAWAMRARVYRKP